MALRVAAFLIVIAIAVLAVLAWKHNAAPPPEQQSAPTSSAEPSGSATMPPGGSAGSGAMPGMDSSPHAQDPGVAWDTPRRWVAELPSGMRLASFGVPAPKSGGESALCAVYYFGPGQGGGVDANLERWASEFREPAKSARRAFEVHGLRVSRIEVRGTYTAHAMTPGASTGESPGWMLLGGIVEGPGGPVFFKLTGPEGSVNAAAKEFDELLASLRKK